MIFWIDIENSAGVKQGGGPILSATRWRSTKRLDRAGTFEFEMPAGDPKALAVAEKLVARCWGIVNGALTELGAGIIDKIAVKPSARGVTMLQVSGDDLLRELTYRSVGMLDLVGVNLRTPDSLVHFDSPSTYTTLSNAIDDNQLTAATVTLTAAVDYLYVGDDATFDQIVVNVGTANANAARLAAEYWNGSAWATLQIKDGTALSGVTLAQDGSIEVEQRADWATTAVNGVTRYWVRLASHATTSAFTLVEVDVSTPVLCSTALADIMAFAPTGWSLDTVNGYATTASAVYARFAGESVLAALVKTAEALGEHFHLGAGRTIVWTRTDTPASGVRAVSVASGIAAEGASELALLVDVEKTADSYDLITRVYPYGAGEGMARLTLAASTTAAPTGYTIDRENNFLKVDAAEATYGQIERHLQWKEIGPLSNSDADLQNAANALQAAATEYLALHSGTYTSYRVRVVNLLRAIEPGETLRLVYHEWTDGYHAVAIDADLVALEVQTEMDKTGIRTTALQVATTDRWPADDQGQIVSQIQQGTIYQAHPQLNANSYTTHYQPHMDADTPATMRFRLGAEVVQVQEVALEFTLARLISTVKTVGTATSSNGGAATVTSDGGGGSTQTSSGGGGHVHSIAIGTETSGTLTPVNLREPPAPATEYTLVSTGGGQEIYTDNPGSHTHNVTLPNHTHDVVIGNHTHTVTPTLTYGIYEASVASTFVLDDLEYRVNGGSWAALAAAVKDLGDGWYFLDLTQTVCNATTLRPLRVANTIEIRRKTSGSFGSRAHCQVDALLQVRNVIQSVAYV